MEPNIDNKINLIWKTIKIVVDPLPPLVVAKSDTGVTAHYFTLSDAHALVNIQPTNIGPIVRLPDNSTMDPQLVRHFTLDLPPAAT